MALYKTHELFCKICEVLESGCHYVDICEIESDDGPSTSLSFEVINDYEGFPLDDLESCENQSKTNSSAKYISDSDFCPLLFTFNEISTLATAVNNALEYYKECSKDKSLSRDTLDEIKQSSVECRNLQAKFAQYFKHVR